MKEYFCLQCDSKVQIDYGVFHCLICGSRAEDEVIPSDPWPLQDRSLRLPDFTLNTQSTVKPTISGTRAGPSKSNEANDEPMIISQTKRESNSEEMCCTNENSIHKRISDCLKSTSFLQAMRFIGFPKNPLHQFQTIPANRLYPTSHRSCPEHGSDEETSCSFGQSKVSSNGRKRRLSKYCLSEVEAVEDIIGREPRNILFVSKPSRKQSESTAKEKKRTVEKPKVNDSAKVKSKAKANVNLSVDINANENKSLTQAQTLGPCNNNKRKAELELPSKKRKLLVDYTQEDYIFQKICRTVEIDLTEEDLATQSICYHCCDEFELIDSAMKNECGHIFHLECILDLLESSMEPECEGCRSEFDHEMDYYHAQKAINSDADSCKDKEED